MKKLTKEQISTKKANSFSINYRSLSIDRKGSIVDNEETFDELIAKRIIRGYGVLWNSKNDFGEIFNRGCFSKSIKENGPDSSSSFKIKFRDRHEKTCSLFAKLVEDEIGLYFETTPLDNIDWCDNLLEQIRTGSVNNFSIGFKYIWDKMSFDESSDALLVEEARLFEISAVDIPSDTGTFTVRSSASLDKLEDRIEEFVSSINKDKQLEVRQLLSEYKSFLTNKSNLQGLLERKKPIKKRSIDYDFLINNLKFS